jgi:hypothetical protein
MLLSLKQTISSSPESRGYGSARFVGFDLHDREAPWRRQPGQLSEDDTVSHPPDSHPFFREVLRWA